MTIPAHDLLMEVSKLTELQQVRVSLKESLKGAALAGVSTLVGGLLLGPIGLAIGIKLYTYSTNGQTSCNNIRKSFLWISFFSGGTIGGCSAALMANNFKSVPYIITHDLTPQQQNDLVAAIFRCLNSIPIRDAADFLQTIARDPTITTSIAMAVVSFINSQPGMEIVD